MTTHETTTHATAAALDEVEYDLTLHGTPALPAWEVVHVAWREALSKPSEGSLVVACADGDADPAQLVGRAVTLLVERGHRRRELRAVVHTVDDLGRARRHRFARLSVASAVWLLGQRVDSRIFQGLHVPAITAEVLRAARVPGLVAGVESPESLSPLAAREYCVQYGESDLAFVSRLLEEEGVAWRSVADARGERLVLVDPATPWATLAGEDGAPFALAAAEAALRGDESVRSWRQRRRVTSTGVELHDYDFTRDVAREEMAVASPPTPGARPVYEHPARYTLQGWDPDAQASTGHDGARRARVRREELEALGHEAAGTSNITGLEAGVTVPLESKGRWRVLEVAHEGHAWGDFEDEVRADVELAAAFEELGLRLDGARYANRFTAVPDDAPWRPARTTPRPAIHGVQTATVRALPGSDEEIATDAHGRVLVEFHWDRVGRRPTSQRERATSCWVRVAQAWAGAQWGFSFIPRVGMEVVVQFDEGDPDRPLVTGCVYNGSHRAPEGLPGERTRSVLRTRSTPGGGGYNELSFEDAAGAEEVFLRAQLDHVEEVLRDQRSTVGHDRALRVGDNRTVAIGARDTLDVGADRVVTIERDDHLTVEGDLTVRVQGERGADLRVDAAWRLVADREIVLECGTSRVVIAPDHVSITADRIDARAAGDHNIEGGMVNINCDDLDDDGPTRRAALREQMLRVGMDETVEEMARLGERGGVDARRLWKRTASALNDWLADQPELLQDRIVLRAGLAMRELLRTPPPPEATPDACAAPLRERFERAEVRAAGDPGAAATLAAAEAESGRVTGEALAFASRFRAAMARDPAWQAMEHEDRDGARDALERQARCLARQRVLGWSERHEEAPGSGRATRVMASATRDAVRAGLDAAFAG